MNGKKFSLDMEFWDLVEKLRCERTGDPLDSAYTRLEEYVEDLIHKEARKENGPTVRDCLAHAVRYHDQLTPSDVERYRKALDASSEEIRGGIRQ